MAERPSRRRDKDDAPTRYTLGPLLEAGVFTAGKGRLSCGVGGQDFWADLGEGGEIFFEGQTFKSPSAFSVYVKRKVNPSRKADDGWTSVKYNGELLSLYRPKLEELISLGIGGSFTPLRPSLSQPSPRASPLRSVPRRKRRKQDDMSETSEEWDEDMDGFDASDDEDYKSRHMPALSGEEGSQRGLRRSKPRADVVNAIRELSEEIPLQEQDGMAENKLSDPTEHLEQCTRPALPYCTPQEFEEDLYAFLTSRKETELVKHLRNKRITCNNTPIDIFGLYREVIRHGGFVDNERYDDYNRWIGGINFAGQIFPKMANYTTNNRATSIGNQLLSNYRKFLLAYEIAHRSKDLEAPEPSTTQAASGLEFLANIASGEASGGEIVDDVDLNKIPKGARGRAARAAKRPMDDDEPESAAPSKRRRPTEGVPRNAGRKVLSQLRKAELNSGRHPPGSLLLAQDSSDLNRHWPVIVTACADLPRLVSSGGTTAQPAGDSFPQTLREATPSCHVDEAYPVCVVGSQVLGWVEAASCRVYNQSSGESAMQSVRPDGVRRAGNGISLQQHVLCARALKIAAQYSASSDPLQANAKAMVQSAGLWYVAQKLVALEGRLPAQGALCSTNFHFWSTWRRSVERAESPAELAPLVLTLAHQLNPDMLARGANEALWDDLRYLLDMEVAAPGLAPMGAANSAGLTVLAIDDAVTAVEEAIDWARVLRSTQLGLPTGSGMRSAQVSVPSRSGLKPGRNGVKLDPGVDLKNCSSNTDLAALLTGAGEIPHRRRSRGPAAVIQENMAFRGDDPGTHAEADRISGLGQGHLPEAAMGEFHAPYALPSASNMPHHMEGPEPMEENNLAAQAQVDSTGSAEGGEGQGSMRGPLNKEGLATPRQSSPDNASPLLIPPPSLPQPQPPPSVPPLL